MIAVSLLSTAAASGGEGPFIEALKVPTRGAAGWEHFQIAGQDYLCVANFFTSRPGVHASMETDSVVYTADIDGSGQLQLGEVQAFRTTGAHGVVHVARAEQHYLIVPNYYGGDAVVLRWAGQRFEELQRLVVDGGGSVVSGCETQRTRHSA